MSVSKIAGVILSSAALVAGHGYVSGAVVDGTYYGGYIVTSYPYQPNPPETIGWSTEAKDLGFVDGSSYSSADIICHKSAKPGAIAAEVKAGGKVELQWTTWPESHHGPVITYLANCKGDCSSVDKNSLEFFKIDEKGLVDGSHAPGTWASDNMISSNNSWTVTIPSSIAAGNYVMRHEIIALHSAGNKNGAQNYPQCLNFKVTGGGSDKPSGTLGTALYKDTDPGILVNIYQSLSSYKIPGPALFSGSSSGSSNTAASSASATVSATPISSVPYHYSRPTSSASKFHHSSSSAPHPTSSVGPTVTDIITATQTATEVENVTVTAAAPQHTKVVAGGGSSSGQSSSRSETSPAPSSSSSTPPTDGNLSDYFSSLSSDQLLNVVRQTLSWLVSNKNHARDLSI